MWLPEGARAAWAVAVSGTEAILEGDACPSLLMAPMLFAEEEVGKVRAAQNGRAHIDACGHDNASE